MKTSSLLMFILLSTIWPQAQVTQAPTVSTRAGAAPKAGIIYRRELGKWWQNSDVAKKLQLSSGQTTQLDQIFYDHRLKLMDYGADMEKEDLKLQTLLDADVPWVSDAVRYLPGQGRGQRIDPGKCCADQAQFGLGEVILLLQHLKHREDRQPVGVVEEADKP